MKLRYDPEAHSLTLESEVESEYWQLSQLSRDTPQREKECDGTTIKLTFSLERNQDTPAK